MLFENKERTYQGPKAYAENDYEYLDRSARKEAANVRKFLETWISQFPDSEVGELAARIKSRDHRSFSSATFEIILFAIISRLGGQLEVHPELENGSTKRPDFLVRMPNDDEFYLEAVFASEFSGAEKAAERRKNVVLEAIEKLESPNFFIGISAEGNPDTPPPAKSLRRDLSNWLSSLDPDKVGTDLEKYGNEHIPTMKWDHDGWLVEFEAIPIKAESRGKEKPVIGFLSGGARFVNKWEPIRDAVRTKGGRYGELTKPFIVAVSVDCHSLGRIDEMQALFGQEECVLNHATPNGQAEIRRARNGAWYGPSGPQYTRVSGAWIFGSLNLWNIVSRKNTLYLNPWAQLPIPVELRNLNHAMACNEKMEWLEVSKLSDLLQLSEIWPE